MESVLSTRIRHFLFACAVLVASLAGTRVSYAQSDLGFRFVRIRYDSVPYSRSQTWRYDYPAAERNLHTAIERTTDIRLDGPPIVLTLLDEAINEYPILYLTEPGFWMTNEQEVNNVRTYLERGGFMIIDDFHDFPGRSRYQWDNFLSNITQVFPDRDLVPLTADHPIWSIYFEVDPVSAPSTKTSFRADEDEYYAIFDDNGRMMVVICYNQDIGDGWEWPNRNMDAESSISFQMAINFIIYALTH